MGRRCKSGKCLIMLTTYRGQTLQVKFNFNYGTDYYDPLLIDPIKDVYVTVVRGSNSAGNIIQNAVSLINSSHRIVDITERRCR